MNTAEPSKVQEPKKDFVERRASKHPSAALSKRDVIDIRKAKGVMSAQELAAKYHISKAHVYDIWNEKAWKSVKLEPPAEAAEANAEQPSPSNSESR